MILIIDNYDSFTYNLVQAFGSFGEDMEVLRNDEVTLDHIRTLSVDRLVISPGPGVPARAGISPSVIRHFAGIVPIPRPLGGR